MTLKNTTDAYRLARTGCILGIFADISKTFFFFSSFFLSRTL